MPETITLTKSAAALLRLHFSGRSLIVGGANPEALEGCTLEATETAYRELVAAGLMMPLHSFVGGKESLYRLTEEAKARKAEFLR